MYVHMYIVFKSQTQTDIHYIAAKFHRVLGEDDQSMRQAHLRVIVWTISCLTPHAHTRRERERERGVKILV